MQQLKLKSSDGVIFETGMETVKNSGTIQKMLLDCEKENGTAIVSLPNVHSSILTKILEWAEHHKDDPPIVKDKNVDESRMPLVFSPWDTEFLKVDQSTLIEIIRTAEYLNMSALCSLGCKYIASMLRGKTTQEMRDVLGIVNDFPPPGNGYQCA